MSVTASHELVLKVNDSLSVKPLVDMMDSVQEWVFTTGPGVSSK